MGKITIQEILASDSISSSRVIINSNYKVLADSINRIETFLDTSKPGSELNVANILIKKYFRPETDEIFICEASSRISGNLTILGSLIVGSNTSNTSQNIINLDTIFKRKITIDKFISGNSLLINEINAPISFDGEFILKNNYVFEVKKVNNNTPILSVKGDLQNNGKNIVKLLWNIDNNSSNDIIIDDGYEGQILILRNKNMSNINNITGNILYFKNSNNTNIFYIENVTNNVWPNLDKNTFILLYENDNEKWKLISSQYTDDYTLNY